MSSAVRQLRIAIGRPAAEAYEFLSRPENFPRWASGLARSLCKDGDDWIAETPEGRAVVRFSEPNAYGVLDHAVVLPRGVTVYVPLRVVAKGDACELVMTLFRRPGASEAQFAADAEWVMRDLAAAKTILEKTGL
jgi:hypothetical protein